jgi:hypothetical protein
VTGLTKALSHRLGALAILLWTDSYTMELPGTRGQLTQERSETLFAKVGGKPLGILLIAETAKLHGPHAR